MLSPLFAVALVLMPVFLVHHATFYLESPAALQLNHVSYTLGVDALGAMPERHPRAVRGQLSRRTGATAVYTNSYSIYINTAYLLLLRSTLTFCRLESPGILAGIRNIAAWYTHVDL
ncbi:hypothetical protein FIBSPDRAFT_896648 [Athelia psychrophila]|uniref:Uncharacterized protein n=1 Tax=Athelia psychrophila TaxID=1759441 RepID=A0A166D7F0_9AGAM|nr:hypothetical protein FIBSPDRAFT_896648 [Fibularhizoctonia sp. CBS 109695]